MTEKKKPKFKPGDHKEFVIATITRGDVRVLFGNQMADKLTNEDMKEIAKEMLDTYIGFHFYDELADALRTNFSVPC
jgi:hypothetical protein